MTDTPLEVIRRQMREAEERLKKHAAEGTKAKAHATGEIGQATAEAPASADKREVGIDAKPDEQFHLLQKSFRALLEASRDSFILVDSQGGWELANHHLPAWLGYTRDQFQGINLTDIFEPEDVRRLLATFPRWLGGDEPITHAPFNLRAKNGDGIPVLLSSHAWINETGEHVAYLVMEDIRGWRRLESQIASTKAFIDAVMRSGTIPTVLMRSDGVIIDVNGAASKWLDADPEKLLNTKLRDYIGASSHIEYDMLVSRALNLQPATNIYCRFRRSSGAEFGSRLSLVGVSDAKGNINRILSTIDRLETETQASEPSSDWTAFGQMTPGLLYELSSLIGRSVRDVADNVRSHDILRAAMPSLGKPLQGLDRARAMLSAWADSAEFLNSPAEERRFSDLLRDALSARKPELKRWSIEATLQMGEIEAGDPLCPPALFPAVLHILQSCIEELRESSGKSRLAIRVQGTGERLETCFLYEVSATPQPTPIPEAGQAATEYRFTNMELRAAQKLLEPIGGTLILENLTETQRAIRMNLSLAVLAGKAISLQTGKKGGAS